MDDRRWKSAQLGGEAGFLSVRLHVGSLITPSNQTLNIRTYYINALYVVTIDSPHIIPRRLSFLKTTAEELKRAKSLG